MTIEIENIVSEAILVEKDSKAHYHDVYLRNGTLPTDSANSEIEHTHVVHGLPRRVFLTYGEANDVHHRHGFPEAVTSRIKTDLQREEGISGRRKRQ